MKRAAYHQQLTALSTILSPQAAQSLPSSGDWTVDNTKLAAAKEEFHCLEKEGIVRR